MKAGNIKGVYQTSKDLATMNSSNAKALHIHAKVAQSLRKYQEAQLYFKKARAFDCSFKQVSPIYNAILKNVAKEFKLGIFDFQQLLIDQSKENYTFKDDIYPQDYYYEKLTDILAIQIRKILRL